MLVNLLFSIHNIDLAVVENQKRLDKVSHLRSSQPQNKLKWKRTLPQSTTKHEEKSRDFCLNNPKQLKPAFPVEPKETCGLFTFQLLTFT